MAKSGGMPPPCNFSEPGTLDGATMDDLSREDAGRKLAGYLLALDANRQLGARGMILSDEEWAVIVRLSIYAGGLDAPSTTPEVCPSAERAIR